MEKFLSSLESWAVRRLTKRRDKKLKKKNKKKTFLSELLDWLEALVFAVFWVIIINQYLLQLFVIPTGSMIHTLEVKDRVVVNKDAYGVELITGGKKVLGSGNRVQRDDIITFYNPGYTSRGPFFDILSQILYMGTLSLVNIDKDEDGNPRERLYVKRAVGMAGDRVFFNNGNVLIKVPGFAEKINESVFREENNLSLGPNRSVDESLYPSLSAASRISVYSEKNIGTPEYIIKKYTPLESSDYNYNFDQYFFSKEEALFRSQLNPEDISLRSESGKYDAGIYVPDGKILPLGDNRDDSLDGRYFGPVDESKINGRVIFRFWPLNRISVLTNK